MKKPTKLVKAGRAVSAAPSATLAPRRAPASVRAQQPLSAWLRRRPAALLSGVFVAAHSASGNHGFAEASRGSATLQMSFADVCARRAAFLTPLPICLPTLTLRQNFYHPRSLVAATEHVAHANLVSSEHEFDVDAFGCVAVARDTSSDVSVAVVGRCVLVS